MEVNKQKPLTLRQRQALATRAMIVSTAQALFLEYGYSSTTIMAIAKEAGVAVSTVYAIFGSKRGILRAIREAWHERSQIRDLVANSSQLNDPAEYLEKLAHATREQWQTGSEVTAIYKAAAAADPEAADELAQALAGRRQGLAKIAHSLQPYFKTGLSLQKAEAILQALCLSEVFNELVRQSNWSPETYEFWLGETLKGQLLENSA